MRSRERGWEAWERPSSSEGRGIWVCGGELWGAYRPGRSETNILGEVIFLVNRSEGPFFGERLHRIPPARPAKELGEKSGAQGGAGLWAWRRGPGEPEGVQECLPAAVRRGLWVHPSPLCALSLCSNGNSPAAQVPRPDTPACLFPSLL